MKDITVERQRPVGGTAQEGEDRVVAKAGADEAAPYGMFTDVAGMEI